MVRYLNFRGPTNLCVFFVLLKINISFGAFNTFGECIRDSNNPHFKECVGRQVINFLDEFENNENFTVTKGVIAFKDTNISSRTTPNLLGEDPLDLRGLVENAGLLFGQRSLQWDLSSLVYPGLELKIGPTMDASSVLEFAMNPRQQDDELFIAEKSSTARIMTRRFLLPLLLGLKFKLAALFPLILAIIVILCKKAAFFAKIAFLLNGFFGIGGGLLLNQFGANTIEDNQNSALGSTLNVGNNNYGIPNRPPPSLNGGYPQIAGSLGYGDQNNGQFNEFLPNSYPGYHHHYLHNRNDRKVTFEKRKEIPNSRPTDNFYHFEESLLNQEQNMKVLERSKSEENISPKAYNNSQRTDENFTDFTWKIVS